MSVLKPSIEEIEDNLNENLGVDNICVRFLLRLYREAQAIVDKLPKYADTGKPFVPDADPCWILGFPNNPDTAEVCDAYENDDLFDLCYEDGWLVNWADQRYGGTRSFYSTREVAEAAMKEGE